MDGVAELKDGTEELKDGTMEVADKVSDIDDKIDEEIDRVLEDIAGGDFRQISFVSSRNENVGLVQFAMQTGSIAMDEPEEEEVEEEEESFLDKLKNLF